MKQLIFNNWNFFRVLRLIMGVAITVQAFLVKDVLLGIAGLLFSVMALLNTGCCGVNGCSTAFKKSTTKKDMKYEEVV